MARRPAPSFAQGWYQKKPLSWWWPKAMVHDTKAPASGKVGASGILSCWTTDGSQNIHPEANPQAICPIVLATADLLAEAMEFAQGYGASVLAAVRESDDEGILQYSRCFLTAARTVWLCGKDLRAIHEARGAR